MGHFYAEIQGNRGMASRMGSKASGITGHIRGWTSGAKTVCRTNELGQDIVEVFLTNGSGHANDKVTGLVCRTIDGKLDFLAKKKYL